MLNPGEVSPDTQWEVVFFDLGEPYVFDGGTFETCEPPTPTEPLPYSVSVVEGCNDGEPIVNVTNTGTTAIYVDLGTFAQLLNPEATVAAVLADGTGRPVPGVRMARLRGSRSTRRDRTGIRHRDGVPRQRLRRHDRPRR